MQLMHLELVLNPWSSSVGNSATQGYHHCVPCDARHHALLPILARWERDVLGMPKVELNRLLPHELRVRRRSRALRSCRPKCIAHLETSVPVPKTCPVDDLRRNLSICAFYARLQVLGLPLNTAPAQPAAPLVLQVDSRHSQNAR